MNQRYPCTGTVRTNTVLFSFSSFPLSVKCNVAPSKVLKQHIHISIFSLNDQTVCSSAGEMELAWYCIFHNSRITTKWQTLATLKFEWFEVCTDFHGRQWWSLYLLSIQPERWSHISAELYERQSKYSLRYGGKCFVECKAWHFQHTSNLIYHNTSHLPPISGTNLCQGAPDTAKLRTRRNSCGGIVVMTSQWGEERERSCSVPCDWCFWWRAQVADCGGRLGRGLAVTTHKEEQQNTAPATGTMLPAVTRLIKFSVQFLATVCSPAAAASQGRSSCYSGDTLNLDKNYK